MVTTKNETVYLPPISSIANINRFLHRFKKILLIYDKTVSPLASSCYQIRNQETVT